MSEEGDGGRRGGGWALQLTTSTNDEMMQYDQYIWWLIADICGIWPSFSFTEKRSVGVFIREGKGRLLERVN